MLNQIFKMVVRPGGGKKVEREILKMKNVPTSGKVEIGNNVSHFNRLNIPDKLLEARRGEVRGIF